MRTALESRMTENADTIIDTEPKIPDDQVSWGVLGLKEAIVGGHRMPKTQVHQVLGIKC